jgi:hypothetical protein
VYKSPPLLKVKRMKNTFVKQPTQPRDNPSPPPYLKSPPPLQHTEMPWGGKDALAIYVKGSEQ